MTSKDERCEPIGTREHGSATVRHVVMRRVSLEQPEPLVRYGEYQLCRNPEP